MDAINSSAGEFTVLLFTAHSFFFVEMQFDRYVFFSLLQTDEWLRKNECAIKQCKIRLQSLKNTSI